MFDEACCIDNGSDHKIESVSCQLIYAFGVTFQVHLTLCLVKGNAEKAYKMKKTVFVSMVAIMICPCEQVLYTCDC